MLLRLSRVRTPLRRYLQTKASRPTSNAPKYALAAGTVATAAFLGIQWNTQDSQPSNESTSSQDFETFLRQRLAERHPRQQIKNLASPAPDMAQEAAVTGEERSAETAENDANGAAFNPETGEINWDCPCLGGMAHGPCGPQFREAFSCFVYSEDEPKGINCVENFQAMQTCFRDHPDVYASEIADDEAAEAAVAAETEGSVPSTTDIAKSVPAESDSSPPLPASSNDASSQPPPVSDS